MGKFEVKPFDRHKNRISTHRLDHCGRRGRVKMKLFKPDIGKARDEPAV